MTPCINVNNVCISVKSALVSATQWTLQLHNAPCYTCIYLLFWKWAVCSDGRATETLRGCGRLSQRADRCLFLRAHSHCRPSRAEPIRLGKQAHVMKWKHSHCTPNRAEPNRTEPDRACSLADVCFHSPADDRFCCAVGLTSGGKLCAFKNECKYIGLRSFNQCGAFKTGFVGTKWQKLSKQRP